MFFIDPNAAKIRLNKPNVVTKEGNIATLAVYVSGYPQPDVYWRKGRRDIDVRKGKYKTLSDGSLQVYCNIHKYVVKPESLSIQTTEYTLQK